MEANTLYSPARSAKTLPPQSLPASAGPTPRSPTGHTAPSPDRQTHPTTTHREPAQSKSALLHTGPNLSATPAAGRPRGRVGVSIGGEHPLFPSAQRESPSSPEPPCERRPDPAKPHRAYSPIARPTDTPHTNRHPTEPAQSKSALLHTGLNPSTTPATGRPRGRVGASIGGEHPFFPSAQRESPSSPEPPCERRPDPAKPHQAYSPIARPTDTPHNNTPRNRRPSSPSYPEPSD